MHLHFAEYLVSLYSDIEGMNFLLLVVAVRERAGINLLSLRFCKSAELSLLTVGFAYLL